MSLKLLFWMIYIVTLLAVVFLHWGALVPLWPIGIVYLLVGILGWRTFGPAVQG